MIKTGSVIKVNGPIRWKSRWILFLLQTINYDIIINQLRHIKHYMPYDIRVRPSVLLGKFRQYNTVGKRVWRGFLSEEYVSF